MGSRGEELLHPVATDHGKGGGSAAPSQWCGGRVRGGGGSRTRSAFRVMCDDVSGVAALEKNSAMGDFFGKVCVLYLGLLCMGWASRAMKSDSWSIIDLPKNIGYNEIDQYIFFPAGAQLYRI